MATLTGQSIAASYEQLLHVDRDGGGNTTTLVDVKDGDNGTTFALQLSTTTAVIDNPTASSASQGGILRLQSDDGAALGDTHRLGVIEFSAAEDGSNTITTGARIEAIADAAWSASENGADMVFYTTDGNASQSEVLRLTADGLVGIGGDPTELVDIVSGTSNAGVRIMNTNADAYGPRLMFAKDGDDPNDNDSAGQLEFYNRNDADPEEWALFGKIRVQSADVSNGTEDGTMVLSTIVNGVVTDNLTIAGGNATFTGDLIMADGKGIDFSADASPSAGMTAEILDDYEEGTWDGVVTDGTNPMTMNSGFDEGYYTKVGNLVTVNGYFATTSLGDPAASGNIRITGLPFTLASADAAQASGACVGFSLDITAGYSVTCNGSAGGTHINLHVWDATTGCTTMQASEWTANGLLIISFSYRAA